ncbi:DUF421 domain-containing protein [Bacillus sp. Xin]|uniref:DUF421 domain-containing protein n=1 Tax=unclassified Bacillus (in: firmicutes) TaxID=185979 RepID=UPI0015727192|nr:MULTISPECIES: DUF421 domain-containing protein [unclassified Bacillus (in: firmicutes)]MBC6974614.1 DUF421 domain-containing protein [Bacillus sp. Xin]NSW34600.1 DUF421 domain-containing protein [Bacillus sp. Xin1]
MELWGTAFRTVLLYFIMLLIFRVMGKREIGELSILDLVVFIMLGELAVLGIIDADRPVWDQIVPMAVIVIIQMVLAYASLKSGKIRHLIDGEPAIIVRKGKIDEKQMRKQRYNMDDLLMQLREEGIGDIRDVEYAILEASGKLSVFHKQKGEKNKDDTPIFSFPLIIDGEMQQSHLHMIEQSEEWLVRKLKNIGYSDITEISYCSFQNGEFFVDLKDK